MKGVTTKRAKQRGKTVAVFGGVHGNERVGIEAVRWAAKNVVPARGTIHFVEANPEAIKKRVRMIKVNLNRRFLKTNKAQTPVDRRARELMKLLDSCDALLDIHSSNSRDAASFVICEKEAVKLAKLLDFPIVSTGWDAVEPGGTDGYMHRNGKLALGVECGSAFSAKKNLPRAKKTILQFLRYFDVIDEAPAYSRKKKRHIRVHDIAIKNSDSFAFTMPLEDFDLLPDGKVFAREGKKIYKAKKKEVIIFPRPKTAIGNEVFLLGKELRPV
jgi:succinylglutamate desuccinylase